MEKSTAAATALLVQPSSAAAERVFSLLKSSFGDQQEAALQDYIETSLMLQHPDSFRLCFMCNTMSYHENNFLKVENNLHEIQRI